MAAALAKLL